MFWPTTPVHWSKSLTEDRPTGFAGTPSLFPEASRRYEAVAATTAGDIDALAPVVPGQARRTVEESDPSSTRTSPSGMTPTAEFQSSDCSVQ